MHIIKLWHPVTKQQVEIDLQKQKSMPHLRLGETLIQEKLIIKEQLVRALQLQVTNAEMHLGEILCNMGLVNQEKMDRILVQKLGIPFISLSKFEFDLALVKTIPEELLRKYSLIPLYLIDSRLVVAMKNPLASDALHMLAFYTDFRIDPVMASEQDLNNVISKFYGAGAGVK
ncbi:GspE/PulE/PilB domain-containing protein [Glaciimonas sp. GNP009]